MHHRYESSRYTRGANVRSAGGFSRFVVNTCLFFTRMRSSCDTHHHISVLNSPRPHEISTVLGYRRTSESKSPQCKFPSVWHLCSYLAAKFYFRHRHKRGINQPTTPKPPRPPPKPPAIAFEDGAETQEKEGVAVGLVAPKTFILGADLTTAASEFIYEIQVEKDGFEVTHPSVFHASAAIALCRTWHSSQHAPSLADEP